jgi:hypothetical protein
MTITVIANIQQHSIRNMTSVELVIPGFFVNLIEFYKDNKFTKGDRKDRYKISVQKVHQE